MGAEQSKYVARGSPAEGAFPWQVVPASTVAGSDVVLVDDHRLRRVGGIGVDDFRLTFDQSWSMRRVGMAAHALLRPHSLRPNSRTASPSPRGMIRPITTASGTAAIVSLMRSRGT